MNDKEEPMKTKLEGQNYKTIDTVERERERERERESYSLFNMECIYSTTHTHTQAVYGNINNRKKAMMNCFIRDG